jgi:ribose transport system permease protein
MKPVESFSLLGIWVALLLLFGACSQHFFTPATFRALANSIPSLVLVASGMTLVLVIGAIDLSVGSVLGFSGAVLGVAMLDWHWPLGWAVLLCLGAGSLAGLLNGFISVLLRIPSFIVTLGMLEIARGLSYLVTRSQTKYIGAPVEGLSEPIPGLGCSPGFLLALLVVGLTQVTLSRTTFGRHLVAIGTNEQAVRLAGIDTRLPKIAVFALLGLFTGLAAFCYTARLGSSDPNAGVGLELSAIAAVVIGGTSLMGGRGSVVNSLLGVLIIATLSAGLAQVGVSEPAKRLITGCVIILAVVVDAWRHHLSGRRFPILRRLFPRVQTPR